MPGHPINKLYSSYLSDCESGFIKSTYLNLFYSLGAYYSERSPHLTYEEFLSFTTIFSCSTVPSLKYCTDEIPLVKKGKITISMEFKEALPTNLLQEMVVTALYPAVVTIDKNRNVLSSFRSG